MFCSGETRSVCATLQYLSLNESDLNECLFFCLTEASKRLSDSCCLRVAGGDAEGRGVRVLVCAVFGDSGTGRQHQPQQPGGSAGDASGGGRHIQPTRWVVLPPHPSTPMTK